MKVREVHPGGRKFCAEVSGLDLSQPLSAADWEQLHRLVYEYLVVVVKSCAKESVTISSETQYELTRRFDPEATEYGHGDARHAASVLHPDLKTVPRQPQVQIIGHGFVKEVEGLQDVQLRHPHHRTFHATTVADDEQYTRFYRWHIDAAFYDLWPPKVTTLYALRIPASKTPAERRERQQTIDYEDGKTLRVPLGATVFASGEEMYDSLDEAAKEFARTTKVEYAPHPYVWIARAKSNHLGLGMLTQNLELPLNQLPPWEDAKIQILPMCWRNPVTDRLALQVHPSIVRKLHLSDGTVVEDLEKARDVVYKLLRPGIEPERLYAHDWSEGDFVIFNNRAVLHTVVGSFQPEDVRVLRQCNLASPEPPPTARPPTN